MKSMFPPSSNHQPHQRPVPSTRFSFNVRTCLLALFLSFAVLLAPPSLGLGALVWWRASKTWDYRERWSGTWALAIVGGLAYGLIAWFALPLPAIFHALDVSLGHAYQGSHSFVLGVTWLGRLWLFNLLLSPACALILEGLRPMTRRTRLLPRYPVVLPREATRKEEWAVVRQPSSRVPRAQALTSPATSSVPASLARQLPRPEPPPLEPLGVYLGGNLYEWVFGNQLCIPIEALRRHGAVVGEPGYGKTMTFLRLASIAVRYGMQVIYIDLKGSKQTAAQFLATMHALGVRRIKVYPREAYDGWRGDANALYNRLMAMVDPGTHPYYRKLTSSLVSLAVHAPGGPPASSREFLARLDAGTRKNPGWLLRAYAGPQHWYERRKIEKLRPHMADLSLTFDGFFDGIAGGLDGRFAYEDADAIYIGLDGDALKGQAASMGRYLLQDAAHYAKHRKTPDLHVLCIVDEFGVLETSNATDLYEHMREAGMAVWASAQSYQGLGRERASVLAAASVKVLHRCGDPEELVKFAGQREVPTFSQMIDEDEDGSPLPTGGGNIPSRRTAVRMQRQYAVPIEEVQQLAIGRVAVITGGLSAYTQVYPVAIPADLLQVAFTLVATLPAVPPQPAPSPPPPKRTQGRRAATSQGQGRKPPPASSLEPQKPPPSPPAPTQVPPAQASNGGTAAQADGQRTAGEEEDDSPVDF